MKEDLEAGIWIAEELKVKDRHIPGKIDQDVAFQARCRFLHQHRMAAECGHEPLELPTRHVRGVQFGRHDLDIAVNGYEPRSTPLAGGLIEEDWSFKTASFTYRLRFHHPADKPSGTQPEEYKFIFWSYGGAYNHTDVNQKYLEYHFWGDDDASLIDISGDTVFSQFLTGSPAAGETANDFDAHWKFPSAPIRFTESP